MSEDVGIIRVRSGWLTGVPQFQGEMPHKTADEILPKWAGYAQPDSARSTDISVVRILDGWGWPMASLWSGRELAAPFDPHSTIGKVLTVKNGYLLPDERNKTLGRLQRARIVPFAPIWPGLAVNTIFYAAVLWLLIGGLFLLRRHLRRRRGLCPACAYPMGEAPICTECGKTLPKRFGNLS